MKDHYVLGAGEKGYLKARIAKIQKELRSLKKRLRHLELVDSDPSARLIRDLIRDACISMRLYNLLHGTRFKTLRDLSKLTDAQMLSIDGFGVKTVDEIRTLLLEAGVQWEEKPE